MKKKLSERTTISGLRNLDDFSGHSHIISLIDPDLPDPEEFAHYDPENWKILKFYDEIAPFRDRQIPVQRTVDEILEFGEHIARQSGDGQSRLFIHCMSGVSRSTAAAIILWAQADPYADADELFRQLKAVRNIAWPNSLMIEFADKSLGKKGKFVEAAYRFFAMRLDEDPKLKEKMTRLRRSSDIENACKF